MNNIGGTRLPDGPNFLPVRLQPCCASTPSLSPERASLVSGTSAALMPKAGQDATGPRIAGTKLIPEVAEHCALFPRHQLIVLLAFKCQQENMIGQLFQTDATVESKPVGCPGYGAV